MCAFNSSHVRALRNQKNSTSRLKKVSNFKNLPFVEPSELLDGAYLIRLWPSDPVKNPFGYLYYKTHTLLAADPLLPQTATELERWKHLKAPGQLSLKAPSHQCPRSSCWDPIPKHYEDDMGVICDEQDFDGDGHGIYTPVYAERCWCCETEGQIADLGINPETLSEKLQRMIGDMCGNEAWHFPATIKMSVAGVVKETREKRDGSTEEVDVTEYREDKDGLFHCDLSLKEGRIKEKLLQYIEEVPDCSHLMMGRWLTLRKQNGGKGVGGYELDIRPNPSPAGFELPSTYPSYSSWGKGNPAYGRPSKRFHYHEMEAYGADPRAPWVAPLQALNVVLSDIPF